MDLEDAVCLQFLVIVFVEGSSDLSSLHEWFISFPVNGMEGTCFTGPEFH